MEEGEERERDEKREEMRGGKREREGEGNRRVRRWEMAAGEKEGKRRGRKRKKRDGEKKKGRERKGIERMIQDKERGRDAKRTLEEEEGERRKKLCTLHWKPNWRTSLQNAKKINVVVNLFLLIGVIHVRTFKYGKFESSC